MVSVKAERQMGAEAPNNVLLFGQNIGIKQHTVISIMMFCSVSTHYFRTNLSVGSADYFY